MIKKLLFFSCLAFLTLGSFAQFQKVSVRQIQNVDAAKLAACVDSSSYWGDTVTFVCKVIADGNLAEVPSSSVQGGFRPFVHVVDTADNGAMGKFSGVQVMGVYTDAGGNSLPVLDVFNLYAGMVVEITGVVGGFSGETQISVLNNSSLKVLSTESAPTAKTIDLGDLNDNTRTNKLTTGEEYEGSFVEIKDLTVSSVINFSGNRVSFDLTDDNGNVINVSDRFLVQKTKSYSTSRASAPYSQGKFVAPVVGTRFEYIRGIIIHSENGCTGATGRGYEINPFDESHYKIGVTPPSITNLVRTPLVPSDTDAVTITAKIVDFDGDVLSTDFYYTDDLAKSFDQFTKVAMTLKSGTTDEFMATIPKFAEGKTIRYYISAEDDDAQASFFPFGASNTKDPDFQFYTIRNNGLSIVDLQKTLSLSRDASPYLGQVVTVTGVVTASAKSYDLEAIYIQDESATEYAGIQCIGNSDLIKLYRDQVVTVTGTVGESFGFTVLNVTKVVNTGRTASINPVVIDINDTNWFTSRIGEKYEGMLVGFVNPSSKVTVSNPRLNAFGEWLIGANEDAPFDRSVRVQSGIQNNNNHSSLWVSIVPDTTLKDNEGVMNVAPIAAAKGMTFDTLVGINFYGFSNFKILPRNDDDLRGASVALPETDYPPITGSVRNTSPQVGMNLFPNPAQSLLNLAFVTKNVNHCSYTIVDVTGRFMSKGEVFGQNGSIDVSQLVQGTYWMTVVLDNGSITSVPFVKQ